MKKKTQKKIKAEKRSIISKKMGKRPRVVKLRSTRDRDAALSRRILKVAQDQRNEIEEEEGEDFNGSLKSGKKKVEFVIPHDDGSVLSAESEMDAFDHAHDAFKDEDYLDADEMDENEERLVSAFMSFDKKQSRTLADLILEKIKEKEDAERGNFARNSSEPTRKLPQKIVEAYNAVGQLLATYKAGKLPKLFKVLPSCNNWEELLLLTKPETWTSHAYFSATKLFASNLPPNMAQRYYNVFLLEKCREEMRDNKRLNYHLYQALCACVFKPTAFFKGIILPLAASGTCTLKEAVTFSSVMSKVSIPSIHAAAALMKLSEMPYTGATSLFIRTLISKKYSLPQRVVDSVAEHFIRFVDEERELPVLWHRSLLRFIQLYKNNISTKHRERMKTLFKAHNHPKITDECRRELFNPSAPKDKTREGLQTQPAPNELAT